MTDLTAVTAALPTLQIELPSWSFGNTGTRFKVFTRPGVPRTPQEKIDDAAQVHALTGAAPSVALHIPWDSVPDNGDLARHAETCRIATRGHRAPGPAARPVPA